MLLQRNAWIFMTTWNRFTNNNIYCINIFDRFSGNILEPSITRIQKCRYAVCAINRIGDHWQTLPFLLDFSLSLSHSLSTKWAHRWNDQCGIMSTALCVDLYVGSLHRHSIQFQSHSHPITPQKHNNKMQIQFNFALIISIWVIRMQCIAFMIQECVPHKHTHTRTHTSLSSLSYVSMVFRFHFGICIRLALD